MQATQVIASRNRLVGMDSNSKSKRLYKIWNPNEKYSMLLAVAEYGNKNVPQIVSIMETRSENQVSRTMTVQLKFYKCAFLRSVVTFKSISAMKLKFLASRTSCGRFPKVTSLLLAWLICFNLAVLTMRTLPVAPATPCRPWRSLYMQFLPLPTYSLHTMTLTHLLRLLLSRDAMTGAHC